MSSWTPTTYKTKNWPLYNAALKQRGSLSIWFDPGMVWTPPPTGKRGRRQEFRDAAIQTCLTLKVLFGLPLRQTTGFVESLLRLGGLDWAVPDFSSLCRRQKTLNVSLPYRGGTGPLNLLIDSTGIKAEGEGEWNARKHGGPKRRIWRKIHIGIDEETLEVRALEVTTSNVGDAPMLPELLAQISSDQDIRSVTADGAYDTRKCHDAIAARGAHAVIPPRKNAKPWKPTSAGAPLGSILRMRLPGNDRPERSGERIAIPGPHPLAAMERVSPQEPCREQDELRETSWSVTHGARLRQTSRGNPGTRRGPEPLHRSRHTCH